MKVSFGGNHLLILNNKRERDNLISHYSYSDSKKDYIPFEENKMIVLDGKEKDDYNSMVVLNKAANYNGAKTIVENSKFRSALNIGYAKKAIVVDLRGYYNTNTVIKSKKGNNDEFFEIDGSYNNKKLVEIPKSPKSNINIMC